MEVFSTVDEFSLNVTSTSQNIARGSLLNSSRWQLSEDIVGPLLATIIGIEFILSLPSNFFIFAHTLAYGRKSTMKSSTIFLCNLALSNLMMSLLYMPLVVVAASAGEWLFGSTDYARNALCQFHGFVFAYSTTVSSHIITCISIDRFLSIVKPVFHHKCFTWKTSFLITMLIWVCDAALILTPYYGSGFGEYDWGHAVGGCTPIWVGQQKYVIILSCVSLIPVVTITVTSLWTFIFTRGFLRKNLRRHRQTLNTENFEVQKHIYSVRVKNLIGLFGTLLLFNAISWVPFLAVSVVGVIIGLDSIPRLVYCSVFVLFLFSNVSNPIVQTYFRKDLLISLKDSLHKITSVCKKKHHLDSSHDSMPSKHQQDGHIHLSIPEMTQNVMDRNNGIDDIQQDGSARDSGFTSNTSAELVQANEATISSDINEASTHQEQTAGVLSNGNH